MNRRTLFVLLWCCLGSATAFAPPLTISNERVAATFTPTATALSASPPNKNNGDNEKRANLRKAVNAFAVASIILSNAVAGGGGGALVEPANASWAPPTASAGTSSSQVIAAQSGGRLGGRFPSSPPSARRYGAVPTRTRVYTYVRPYRSPPVVAVPGYSFRYGFSPGYGYRYAPTFGYPYGYGYNPFGGFGLGFGLGATIGGPNAGRAVQEYQQERQLDQVKAELQAEKIKAEVMEERLKQLEEQQQQPQPTQ